MAEGAAGGRLLDDFGRYEIGLFAATQLGYLPIVGSLLATNFFEPPPETCANESVVDRFHSLLAEWQLACTKRYVMWLFSMTDIMSTTLMFGGLLGAFIAGFLADRYGRKPLVVGTMGVVGACNTLLCVLGMRSYLLTGLVLLVMGAAAGGYMVVNLVLMVEAVEHSHSRLLIVSLNGWPLAMCFTALIAFFTRHWLLYHAFVATIAFFFFAVLQCISLESVRWLTHHNHTSRAQKTIGRIAYLNSASANEHLRSGVDPSEPLKGVSEDGSMCVVKGNHATDGNDSGTRYKYTYVDLFKHKSVGISVASLAYCFTVSSFVSFSGYFHSSLLPGNRFLSLFSMGLLKLLLGMIPFACGSYLGRRPILLTSIAVAMLCSSALTFMLSSTQFRDTDYLSMLSVLMASALDPSWKIMHLYSTELFPTGVRNMARGICQVGARCGSVLAPIMRSFYGVYPVVSMAICMGLLAVQWLIAFFVFPETSRCQLPDRLPTEQST